jgi:CRISPR/Cas system-associated exonuclease Cas4 (RecB family)
MAIKNDKRETQLIKLSASAVKTYDQCPKKYFFNYIERAPRKQWDHFDLGNLCHETLELFHLSYMKDGTSKRTLGETMSVSFAEARKKFPKMTDSMLLEAKDMLRIYLQTVKQNGMPNVKGVETSFSFNLTENILVRGFLDRLDIMKDGRFHIIDYKTTKPKSAKYLDEFQLLVYGLWLKREYPKIESFKGSYLLLRADSMLKSFDFNVADVERIEKDLISYASKIREENIWTAIPTPLCNWCDFKGICPAQKSW